MGASTLQGFPTPDNSSVFGVPADLLALANVMEKQVVMRFTNAAARDAAITAPEEGMVAALTSDNEVTWHNGVGWRPGPWNAPWGRVAAAVTSATDQTGISTVADITGLATVSWTAFANRRYRVTLNVNILQNTSAATSEIIIANGANTILRQRSTSLAIAGVAGVTVIHELNGLAAGSQTVKGRAVTGAGTLTIANSFTRNGELIVEDIGPNGAPA
jgi:hypothetical protein